MLSPLQVLSVGIQGVFSDLQSPVVYRIYSNEMILPSRNEYDILQTPEMQTSSPYCLFSYFCSCVIWQDSATPAGAWDSSVCTTRVREQFVFYYANFRIYFDFLHSFQTSVFEQDFIECECRRMGDFAATIPPNYGWTLPAPITCAIVLVW